MFHVTRCPNCRTSFKVTDQHLAAFEGKVRCGRCAFVFNAREHFIGEPTPAPMADQTRRIIPSQTVTPSPPATAKPPPPAVPTPAIDDEGYDIDSVGSQLEAAADASDQQDLTTTSLRKLAAQLRNDKAVLSQSLGLRPAAAAPPTIEAEPSDVPSCTSPSASSHVPPATPVAGKADDTSAAGFPVTDAPSPEPVASRSEAPTYRPILTAEDEALLRVPRPPSPWRWLWSVPTALAAAALVLQVTLHYRTDVAIQLPGAAPVLARLCAELGCTMDLPARSELLRTEWSELVYVPDHPELIQLSATLRNQAAFSQAMPLMQLTLTDEQDRVVTRKLFKPAEYLAPLANGQAAPVPDRIGPGEDLRVFLRLDVGTLKTAGYEIQWRYPQRH
jgi:predicted Zn finger-like uncharacterized protein